MCDIHVIVTQPTASKFIFIFILCLWVCKLSSFTKIYSDLSVSSKFCGGDPRRPPLVGASPHTPAGFAGSLLSGPRRGGDPREPPQGRLRR